MSRAYSQYPLVYRSVVDAKVLDHDGDVYHVLMQLKERQAGFTVLLQIRSTIVYEYLSDTLVCTCHTRTKSARSKI